MRTIGLLGGMSWESSVEYERLINESPDSHLVDSAKRALERLNNPAIVAFYDKYKLTSVPEAVKLPKRPDISFPELPLSPTESNSSDRENGSATGDTSGETTGESTDKE